MNKQIEIFENEEATKFLDYFVAYMKLMDTVDNIKNIATQHNEMNLLEVQPTETSDAISELNDSPLAMDFPPTLDK